MASKTTGVAFVSGVLDINMRETLLCNRAICAAMLNQEEWEFQRRHEKRSLRRKFMMNLGSANSLAAFPGKASYMTAKTCYCGNYKDGRSVDCVIICVYVSDDDTDEKTAVDYAAHGIRVNSVCPIWISGPMNKYEASVEQNLGKIVQAAVPLKRIAQSDEVADVTVFLCSLAASFITGTSMFIDAGAGLTVRLF